MANALPFLQFIRNARNCIEHPKPSERIVVTDFVLRPDMQVMPPTIEVIHPKSPQPPVLVIEFIAIVIDQSSLVFEIMVALMCANHVQPFSGMPFQVIELPEGQRRDKQVRFSYANYDGIPCLGPG
jgi:hypothetical protein